MAWTKEQHRTYLTIRRQENKKKVIDLLGGECAHCGLKDHPEVYDIHHINPATKDFRFGQVMDWSWKKIENELNKGVLLLCANCHRKEHVRLKGYKL